MQLTSMWFLIYFALTAAVYFILPARVRYIWLFVASLAFYLSQGPAHTIFLVFSALTTWVGGLLLEKYSDRVAVKKAVVGLVAAANLGVLCFFKYIGFFTGGRLQSPILPIGLSFYSFQAIGYLVDVYREKVSAEKNPLRYGLFVAFFPTVLSGPIERAGRLIHCFTAEYQAGIRFDADRTRDGMVRMLWGYFLKLVLADRLAVAVNAVYSSPESYGGAALFFISVLYSFQIYLDFAGYSSIAIGAARVLGIGLTENFDAPYLSRDIGEFWRRWHISLSTWFRDYLYIPLGGSRRGEGRRLLNLMIVFVLSGLWHGAGLTFLIWGALHGAYQVVHVLLFGRRKGDKRGSDAVSVRILRTAFTFVLVDLAWIFFRADSVGTALSFFKGFARPELRELLDGTLMGLGLGAMEWGLLALGIAVVAAVDILRVRGVVVSEWLSARRLYIRWPVYIAGVLLVLVCGVWGAGYDAASFLYYNF